MGTILAYEIKKQEERMLKELADRQKLQIRVVEPSAYEESLGFLAGITGFKRTLTKGTMERLGESMLVFSGMDSQCVEEFLDGLKKADPKFRALKAVITPYNITWNSRQLLLELQKERDAFQKER